MHCNLPGASCDPMASAAGSVFAHWYRGPFILSPRLGSVPFTIFVNPIFWYASFVRYADNIVLVVSHKSFQEEEEIEQNYFIALVKWTHDKGLVINLKLS